MSESQHRVFAKPTATTWTILYCADPDCPWFEGFLNRGDAESAKRLHEESGVDVEGDLRRLLRSGAD